MDNFYSTAMLLLMLLPQQAKLPAEFYRIPQKVRTSATVVFSGVYERELSPHIPRGNTGVYARYILTGFTVENIYRGRIGSDYIGINSAMLPKTGYVCRECLVPGHHYLVLLKPSAESLKIIRTGEGRHYYLNALDGEEIVAFIELK
jgi:hypothetical protein